MGALLAVVGLVMLGVGFASKFADASEASGERDGWTYYAPLSDGPEGILDRWDPELWVSGGGAFFLLGGGLVVMTRRRPENLDSV